MSPNNSPAPAQHPDIRSSECGSALEEDDLEKLESDVNQVVQKIHHCRTDLPDQLRKTLHAVLSSQRPVLPITDSGSEPGTSGNPNPDAGIHDEPSNGALLSEEEKEVADKIQLLRQKISSNVSSMPILLKRMKECVCRIDNFNSCSRIIHPAFKKRRTS